MNVLIKNQSQYIFKTKNLDKNVKNDNISLLRRGASVIPSVTKKVARDEGSEGQKIFV